MADFDSIFAEPHTYTKLFSSIENGSQNDWQRDFSDLRLEKSDVSLAPTLTYYIQVKRLKPLLFLLKAGAEPDDTTVEAAAANSGNSKYLAALLEHGWLVNSPLRSGQTPSVLW